MEKLSGDRRNFLANAARPASRFLLSIAELGLPIKLRQEVLDSRDHLIDALGAEANEAEGPIEIDNF